MGWCADTPLGSSIDLLRAANLPSYREASITLRELSESRDGLQTTACQIGAASLLASVFIFKSAVSPNLKPA